jgi:hypothetical protein
VPKKEQTSEERAVQTKKHKDCSAVVRGKKAHQDAEAATKVTTKMALEMQTHANV